MPFGLSGTTSTFQKVVETVLSSVLNDWFHVYLDYIIIITSATVEEHQNHLREVFELSQQMGLTLNMDKSSFGKNYIEHFFKKVFYVILFIVSFYFNRITGIFNVMGHFLFVYVVTTLSS